MRLGSPLHVYVRIGARSIISAFINLPMEAMARETSQTMRGGEAALMRGMADEDVAPVSGLRLLTSREAITSTKVFNDLHTVRSRSSSSCAVFHHECDVTCLGECRKEHVDPSCNRRNFLLNGRVFERGAPRYARISSPLTTLLLPRTSSQSLPKFR